MKKFFLFFFLTTPVLAGYLKTSAGDPWLKGGPKTFRSTVNGGGGVAVVPIAPVSGAHLIATNPSNNDGFTSSSIDTTGVTLLVVDTVFSTNGSGFGVSDSKGNTYIGLTAQSAGSQQNRIFYVVNPVVGTGHTFTIAGTGIVAVIAVQGFNGQAASPFDAENGSSNNGAIASIQPGNVTPAQDNELIVSGYSAGTSSNLVSIDSGFTISDQVAFSGSGGIHFALGMAYIIKGVGTSGVAVNPTWTIGGSDTTSMDATIAAFKKAP